ncbi:MAG: glycosyltransferase family 2 protein [Candidatus Nealsonbacteria bacterium]|nr:glycosyltransferase family 2 protein [Candidatus Nealsonbacteria bacterium]
MNLKIATAQDLTDPSARRLFRFLEILPGAVSWLTIFLAIFLSWWQPFFVATFILVFDLYWFFRAIYFSFHLHSSYQKMEEHKKIDWLSRVKQIQGWEEIHHLCLFTLCREPLSVVRDAFLSLAQTDYPKEKILVVLSAEESCRSETQATVDKIQAEFGQQFGHFLVTWHPQGLAGEITGKGSNDRWAEVRAKEEVVDRRKIPYEKVVVSFFDVDTCLFPKYFSCLSWHYLTAASPYRTSFQPIPLFINNIWQAPIFSRTFALSSTFWSTLSQERPEKLITFSSHAMSFQALAEVGFKQANIVSDDSRIFWQSFLQFNSDYQVQPLYYPVGMDANVAPTFRRTLINIYKQQRRWAYGVDEIPYVFFNFLQNKKISLKKKLSQGFFLFESHWSWATSALLIFLLGWLPLALGGERFSQTLIAHNLPHTTSRLMTIAMVGLFSSIYFSFSLLPPRPKAVGRLKYLVFILEWLILPSAMLFFWTVPALDAQTRLMLGKYLGFWPTEKHRQP